MQEITYISFVGYKLNYLITGILETAQIQDGSGKQQWWEPSLLVGQLWTLENPPGGQLEHQNQNI